VCVFYTLPDLLTSACLSVTPRSSSDFLQYGAAALRCPSVITSPRHTSTLVDLSACPPPPPRLTVQLADLSVPSTFLTTVTSPTYLLLRPDKPNFFSGVRKAHR